MEAESTLRVIYEDPEQRAEKKKLIALFEKKIDPDEDMLVRGGGGDERESINNRVGKPQESGPKKKLVRRVTRTTGR
jgi:hypothetical protein